MDIALHVGEKAEVAAARRVIAEVFAARSMKPDAMENAKLGVEIAREAGDPMELAKSLFLAVKVLKQNNLIHRDIKPDNVMALKNKERPFVLLDLGIAFKLHGSELTRNPDFRPGTLPYMA
ncbi:MAG: hypothetical protein IID15_09030, partial [Candidatus Marinimicrobia bacterium]|nr:hypothetical protein [Candidatus Neomarinimicrobiota bacterium]